MSPRPAMAAAALAVVALHSPVHARPVAIGVAAPSFYQRALKSCQAGDYAQALEQLERASAETGSDARTRADLLNLRGTIYLGQGRIEKARAAFVKVIALNADLWTARFNLAEIDFRQKRYAESQRAFAALLGSTSRSRQPDEWAQVEYKMQLSALLLGQEDAVAHHVAQIEGREKAPLYGYYLKAALAMRRHQPEEARRSLAAAKAKYPPEAGRDFAESLQQLGWLTDATAGQPASSRKTATVAVVQIMPEQQRPAVRPGTAPRNQPPPPSVNPVISSQDVPPAPTLAPADDDETGDIAPGLLARKRPAPKPTPSPTPANEPPPASPAGSPAATATPAPAATPSPDPASPAFLQRYESAYIKFLEKDYAGARALLNEADAIQPNQPASIDLRNKIFSYYYKIAYGKYSDKDYTGAQTSLDDADSVQKDQPDSLNLRGLIYSRQRVFDQAEVMFKKAVQADPSFWAAKFNMAELPFTYKNYTVARSRYEQLLAETDASKQPREAELTHFKVFLTLLLEGKETAARAFMDHFSFTGATPARYYCQAALDFYAGSADKAAESIAEARKEYPAQIEAIFADSFYRVGWLTDPGKPATGPTAVAAAEAPEIKVTPSPAPIVSTTPATPSDRLAIVPSASPRPTPMIVAAVSPSPTPVPVPTATPAPTGTPLPTATPTPAPTATSRPTATATPTPLPTATAKPTATATPAPTVTAKPTATATPAPTATVKPTAVPAVVITPTAAPSPTATPSLSPTATPSPTASPRPTATVAPTSIPTPVPTVVPPEPSASPVIEQSPGEAEEPAQSPQEGIIRLFALLLVPIYLVGSWAYVIRRALAIKAEKRRPGLHYGGSKRPPGDTPS